jgi:hypothetical protein
MTRSTAYQPVGRLERVICMLFAATFGLLALIAFDTNMHLQDIEERITERINALSAQLRVEPPADTQATQPTLPLQVASAFDFTLSPTERPIKSGYAVYYSAGVMERVARFRNIPVERRLAANTDCWRIGMYVTARVNGYVDTYRIVDCSHPRDRARHLRQGLVIEVNYAARQAYFPRGAGRANAQVLSYSGTPCRLVNRKCVR